MISRDDMRETLELVFLPLWTGLVLIAKFLWPAVVFAVVIVAIALFAIYVPYAGAAMAVIAGVVILWIIGVCNMKD